VKNMHEKLSEIKKSDPFIATVRFRKETEE
jgi:hypothetical protein